MTVAAVTRKQIFPGSGTNGPFTFNFRVLSKSHIRAVRYNDDGTTTTLTEGSGANQYSITLTNNGQSGGAVTTVTDIEVGESLLIVAATPLTQATGFRNDGAFFAERHEDAFDKLTLIVQELSDESTAALRLNSLDDETAIDTEIPVMTASSVLVTNAAADGFEFVSLGSLGEDIDTLFTSLASGDFMQYNGTNWVNKTAAQVRTAIGITALPLQAEGSQIASATTTDIGAADSDFFDITGAEVIVSLGSTTTRNHVWVKFTGAVTLTHNATSLILPTGANIVTEAGDIAELVRISGSNWQCLNYVRADGEPLKMLATQEADASPTSGTVTLNMNSGHYRKVTAGGNFTLDITPVTGRPAGYVLELVNGGAYTITWTGVDDWADGAAPSLTSSGTDLLGFIADDDGVVRGYLIGSAFA